MTANQQVLQEVRAALHSEPRFGPPGHVGLAFSDGTLTMEGEVQDVAVKKLLLERAAAHPRVRGIIDRLRVAPSQRIGD